MSEIDQYDYPLPKELIAQHPLANRSDARLMVVDRQQQQIAHWHVRDLPELIAAGDCLVLNETRVLPAKLVGARTKTGGRWHGLFLEADSQGVARLLCKTRGRLEPGETVSLQSRSGADDVRLVMLARLEGGEWAARTENEEDWQSLLGRVGRIPLPHYIRGGNMTDADIRDYQTVYAKQSGSVAAPTAGLHFTKELLLQLKQRGVHLCQVTLHVGIGTFRPIATDRLDDHRMHREQGQIEPQVAATLAQCRQQGKRIIAVGTTSTRLLETAASNGQTDGWQGETELFIRPPYRFKGIDALMTNFHLPRSTLLVLVRTFGGDALMQRAYQEAIDQQYRFFSYGDAMLIV